MTDLNCDCILDTHGDAAKKTQDVNASCRCDCHKKTHSHNRMAGGGRGCEIDTDEHTHTHTHACGGETIIIRNMQKRWGSPVISHRATYLFGSFRSGGVSVSTSVESVKIKPNCGGKRRAGQGEEEEEGKGSRAIG